MGQKALARTSQNPGHTQQLNFFLLGENLMLVDMPGYGYAKVSKERKGEWDLLIRKGYLGRAYDPPARLPAHRRQARCYEA